MADEVKHANVVRVTKDGNCWCALIGPDLQLGLAGFGKTPYRALIDLAMRCLLKGWSFDESWVPDV